MSESTVPQCHPPAAATPEHRWLAQLVGEWSVVMEATMVPGEPPIRSESTESVRRIGELWIQGDGRATFGGQPFQSVLTVGYDLRQNAFVGTWIDSMQTHQWHYRGQLDAARRVLTLEAEGPSMQDPTCHVLYRDALEIVGPDHKVLTSAVQGADGQWTQFMRADYRRRG